jgi:hypothetical protein
VLAGDRDRELAASALRRHFVDGRLSLAEFARRVELALGARSRTELAVAKEDLPPVWEDLPAGLYGAARRVHRGFRRTRRFLAFVRVWFKLNLVLLLALGIALAVGAPVAMTIGAAVAAWALTSLGVWHVWRKPAD